ncbi:MAG TPA: hypothetical protein ENK23_02380 [Sorangium sp.]|nr:hypothetical protein [Sorangium sp.]
MGTAALLGGCIEGGPAEEEEPTGTHEEALQGAIHFQNGPGIPASRDCSFAQKVDVILATWRARDVVASDEFADCMRTRVLQDYMVCAGDDHGGGATVAHADDVIDMLRSNTAATTYRCSDALNPFAGYTHNSSIYTFDHTAEGLIDLGVPDRFLSQQEKNRLAGTIAHEAMHTHGYLHDNCGAANYIGNINSMPNIVGQCMAVASKSGTILAQDSASTSAATPNANVRSLVFGDYNAVDLGNLAGKTSSIFLPPGHRVTACNSNLLCGEFESMGYQSTRSTVPGVFTRWNFFTSLSGTPLNNSIVSMKVEPVATAYDDSYMRSTSQTFTIGDYTAQQLGAVGNNHMSSLHLPPGLATTVCLDDINNGRRCKLLRRSQGDFGSLTFNGIVMNNGVSMLKVRAAITLFKKTGFAGESDTTEVVQGLTIVRPGYRGFVVPDGITVQVCPLQGGACTATYTSSQSSIPVLGANQKLRLTFAP